MRDTTRDVQYDCVVSGMRKEDVDDIERDSDILFEASHEIFFIGIYCMAWSRQCTGVAHEHVDLRILLSHDEFHSLLGLVSFREIYRHV